MAVTDDAVDDANAVVVALEVGVLAAVVLDGGETGTSGVGIRSGGAAPGSTRPIGIGASRDGTVARPGDVTTTVPFGAATVDPVPVVSGAADPLRGGTAAVGAGSAVRNRASASSRARIATSGLLVTSRATSPMAEDATVPAKTVAIIHTTTSETRRRTVVRIARMGQGDVIAA